MHRALYNKQTAIKYKEAWDLGLTSDVKAVMGTQPSIYSHTENRVNIKELDFLDLDRTVTNWELTTIAVKGICPSIMYNYRVQDSWSSHRLTRQDFEKDNQILIRTASILLLHNECRHPTYEGRPKSDNQSGTLQQAKF